MGGLAWWRCSRHFGKCYFVDSSGTCKECRSRQATGLSRRVDKQNTEWKPVQVVPTV